MAEAESAASRIAIVGAGPAGLALALLAAQRLPQAQVTLFDARPATHDVAADPRTLALALGSVQLLRRLQAWPEAAAQPITEVHVSQRPPAIGWRPGAAPEVWLRAADEGVEMLGAVLSYGTLVAPLQRAWHACCEAAPARLVSRMGTPVAGLKPLGGDGGGHTGVEVDAGIVEVFDLAVVAEGGVFADQSRKALTHDYRQTAWVGQLVLEGGNRGLAIERFTPSGPLALLPLPAADAPAGTRRAALVWCVAADDDPVATLADGERIVLLNALLPEPAGRVVAITPLKAFALGLNAETTLVRGRTVRIGNAAQTLHPVAGQGLNLGLRDAFALVDALRRAPTVDAALRRIEWARTPDRWSMMAATDFLARSFTWRWPGLALARGGALSLLNSITPAKSLLARQMMFGRR
ncbi:MAG: FAD-dependent monooxygenase [Ideonella sp.]|nr:FAD-dependent monooxygenase [Ideonella sp.]MCC7455837.1 FAD-dependent monooxygenase [Nitrospira sp.]